MSDIAFDQCTCGSVVVSDAQAVADTITALRAEVEGLRAAVAYLQGIVNDDGEEEKRLRARVEELEKELRNIDEMSWTPTDRETYQDLFAEAQNIARAALTKGESNG